MKKLLILMLAFVLAFSACGNTANNESKTEEKTDVANETKDNAETSGEETTEENAGSFQGDYIISAKDAIAKVGDENVIFIDARGKDGAKDGHIEGAIVMAWGEIANMSVNPGEKGWGHILPPEELSKKLGDFGIDPAKEIILYSTANQGWGEDGRILWELKAAGYKNLKMVDGGINALKEAGANFVKEDSTITPVEVKISEIDRKNTIDTDELSENYEDYKIIDSREKKEYDGATDYGEAKGGHLPGAINITYSSLFNEKGYLKSNAELKKMFEDASLSPEDNIVTYCTGGIRSAYMQLVMEMLGYSNVKNYEGSYYNWATTGEVE